MNETQDLELMLIQRQAPAEIATTDAGASPFRTVVDPAMRVRLKKALLELIDNHDRSLETYVSNGQLKLDSYKEYIELFARCLRETMETREGVAYLLKSCGFEATPEEINLYPDWRWEETPSQ
ncbi:MAG: hypothetical protein PHD76_02255 [Methylacidiphilales bacterium]|nr:hypothetical protein [Candidatus Methylacidiphilales bacterium]